MRLRTLLSLGLVATLGFAVWVRRADLAAFDWTTDPATLAAAVALLAVPGLVQAGTFVVALRRVGATAPWRDALRMWSRSWLLRYEPAPPPPRRPPPAARGATRAARCRASGAR